VYRIQFLKGPLRRGRGEGFHLTQEAVEEVEGIFASTEKREWKNNRWVGERE
jgi:hypothetical protein